AQDVSGAVRLVQGAVGTEVELVVAIAQVGGEADFAGGQVEQAALHGGFGHALGQLIGVGRIAAHIVHALGRGVVIAERVEASGAELGPSRRAVQQASDG